MTTENVRRARKNAKRGARRVRIPNPFAAAWSSYRGAKRRLNEARRRLTTLSDRLDEARDDHRQAVEDAAEALSVIAVPSDRHPG